MEQTSEGHAQHTLTQADAQQNSHVGNAQCPSQTLVLQCARSPHAHHSCGGAAHHWAPMGATAAGAGKNGSTPSSWHGSGGRPTQGWLPTAGAAAGPGGLPVGSGRCWSWWRGRAQGGHRVWSGGRPGLRLQCLQKGSEVRGETGQGVQRRCHHTTDAPGAAPCGPFTALKQSPSENLPKAAGSKQHVRHHCIQKP